MVCVCVCFIWWIICPNRSFFLVMFHIILLMLTHHHCILGEMDHLPEVAFYMVGPIEEVVQKAERLAEERKNK